MKKLLLILLCLPMIGFGQTLIPDANFEQALINLGYDTGSPNGSVPTANINTITTLIISNMNISDLTGIEAFIALQTLYCSLNPLTSLDVSQNTALTYLESYDNGSLSSLDVRNGNNTNMVIDVYANGNLTCISVDNAVWSTANWTVANDNIDPQHYFSNNCSGTGIEDHSTNKKLLRTIDVLGRETKSTPLFYIYDDGTVEKRIVIE